MRTTQDYELQGSYVADYDAPAAGSGWLMFATIMLGLAGIWNLFEGILAISSSRVYAGHETFIFSDLNTWGWIVMILGLAQVLAALALFRGSELARWFGIGVAGAQCARPADVRSGVSRVGDHDVRGGRADHLRPCGVWRPSPARPSVGPPRIAAGLRYATRSNRPSSAARAIASLRLETPSLR